MSRVHPYLSGSSARHSTSAADWPADELARHHGEARLLYRDECRARRRGAFARNIARRPLAGQAVRHQCGEAARG
jgi:hypothetical protein